MSLQKSYIGAVDDMQELATRRFAPFVKVNWPVVEAAQLYMHNWHVDAIAEHLEACKNREIRNLLINIPPRHAKSTLVSVMLPAWIWCDPRHSHEKFIYASHAFNLSKRDSVKCRNLVRSSWYNHIFRPTWKLAADQNEKMRFDNTDQGYRIATSVGSSVIGQGGDWLLVDDPHSPKSASYDNQRQTALNWFDEEFSMRVIDPKTCIKIIIMQRLHQKDLSGHVLEKGNWDHLMLPAEYEETRKIITSIGWEDPRKTNGEPLWADRFGTEVLAGMKKDLGTRAAAGQLQQRPAPADGEIVKREWWKYYKAVPNAITGLVLSADLTFKDGEKNDFAVFQIWGRVGADKYLLDQVRARMGFTNQLAAFRSLIGKWPKVQAKYVEDAANGSALIATLRKEIPGIIPVKPTGSKVSRAEAVSPQIEAGNVYLPDPSIAPWIHDYVEEWAVFPNAEHDDQIDATTQALSKMTSIDAGAWKPISITGPSKWTR